MLAVSRRRLRSSEIFKSPARTCCMQGASREVLLGAGVLLAFGADHHKRCNATIFSLQLRSSLALHRRLSSCDASSGT